MIYDDNDFLNQKKEELKNDFELFLNVRYRENKEDQNIGDALEKIKNFFKDIYGKDVFDITSVKEFDIVRNETEYQSISIDEESDLLDEIIDAYRDFLIAYTFAKEWVKPREKVKVESKDAKNLIVYGAPGTGKSWYINSLIGDKEDKDEEDYAMRVTFHPESDYASFVGCFKPTENESGDLTYSFVPQAFTEAYIRSWKMPKEEPYYLIIEEINRGNCAQIFGDIFQLLDRYEEDCKKGKKGQSKYPIKSDKDLENFLKGALADCDFSDIPDEKIRKDVQDGKKLMLPSNLWILATMNTSDQSLYPMDSAFKRRWEWKYIPISYDRRVKFIVTDSFKNSGEGFSWEEFLKAVNAKIFDSTKSEDKQLGFWFTGESQTISVDTFVNKVVFYLWNDIFKDYRDQHNSPFAKSELTFQSFYNNNGDTNLSVLETFLKKGLELEKTDNIFPRIDENVRSLNIRGTRTKEPKFTVTYNGKVFDDPVAKNLFVDVIKAIGPDKIVPLGRAVYNGPLIVSNKEELSGRDSVELGDGLHLLVGLSNKDKKKILEKIREKLHLELKVNETTD